MRRRLAPLVVLAAMLFAPALPAIGAEFCATHADVTWVVDHERVTVSEAHVEVPGCADGDVVGLQLITDDGDVPAGPLLTGALSQRAVFDLRPLDIRVEPVIGVRVFLTDLSSIEPGYEITVERRFFNPAGNEQRGLRELTTLHVPVGETYTVAGPPDRHRSVACADVGLEPPDDAVDEGSGTFAPTASGRHLVCFRLTTGPPSDDDTDVLDESLIRDPHAEGPDDPTAVLPASQTRDGALPRTGLDAWSLAALGLALLAAGIVAVRSRRRTAS